MFRSASLKKRDSSSDFNLFTDNRSKRLQDIKDGLNPQSSFYCFIEGQHPNIRAVIRAYEDGLMAHGRTTYFNRGKIVSEAEAAMRDDFVWEDVCSFFQFPKFHDITHSSHRKYTPHGRVK